MAKQLTEVRLLSVPLENDYKHTLYFSDRTAQTTYFQSKTVFVEAELSYQRKDGFIRFPKQYDELDGVNYVMYRNEPYSTKWKYAFITSKKYVQDDRTDIYIETDVIQTYFFDYLLKPSFVEREHVDDDTTGLHTVPEGLEMGEYVVTYINQLSELQKTNIVLGVTESIVVDIETLTPQRVGGRFNGLYSGLGYYSFENNNIQALETFLEGYDNKGKGDAVNCMFIAPEFLSGRREYEDGSTDYYVLGSENPSYFGVDIGKTIINNRGEVRNNKLNTYPYKYLLVSNNNGASAIYQYEHFDSDTMRFGVYGVLSPGCSIRLVPKSYKGLGENFEEGLNLGKYPICNWTSDVYTNWLTQNSVNIGLNMISGLGQIIGGAGVAVASGGLGMAVGGGQMIGGVSTITNQLAQMHQMSFTPPQSHGNVNCGDVVTASNNNTFTFYAMSIKPEYLQIIDGYFDMFGYKVNSVKTPLKNHRESYWYTKTIDVSIDGAIPMEDMQKIKNCYNNGITFWRNPSNIGNYSVSNSII